MVINPLHIDDDIVCVLFCFITFKTIKPILSVCVAKKLSTFNLQHTLVPTNK